MSAPPQVNWHHITAVQVEITRWATEQFPHRTDHHAIYKLMVEEIPELAMHKKKQGEGDIGLELADCFILLLDLASLWGVDVAAAIRLKMEINYQRQWNMDVNGIMQHVPLFDDSCPPAPARLAEGTPITGIACPNCHSKEEVKIARSTGIYLYHCLQCGNEFDDDIPF